MFLKIIYPIKPGRFWWNLLRSILNKSAAKWCKCFPLYLNNVFTLPCETWNAHRTRVTIQLLQEEAAEFMLFQLRRPNFPNLNPVAYSLWGLLQDTVYKYASLMRILNEIKFERTETTTKNGVGQAGSCLLRQPFVNSIVDSPRLVMLVSYIFPCNISHTLNCIQNWRSLKWEKGWSFFL